MASPSSLLLFSGLLLAAASPVRAAVPQEPPLARSTSFAAVPGEREFSGRLIARPIQPAARAARDAMAHFAIREYVEETDEYVFLVPPGASENLVAANLMASGVFQYVEPDWILYPVGAPNDPQFGNQWHHAANRMDSAAGWDLHTGDPSVSVGICDTGVLTTHEDLLLHRLEGYNAVDRKWESAGGAIAPVHPHGTETTGCAAANGNNGKGVSGVGWDLSHRMLRVSNSSSGSASLSDLTHAARTAVESGDKVASVSYSGVDSSTVLTTGTYLKSIGGLLVWAAGNDGRRLTYSNRDSDDVIVAGATDSSDNKSSFSAYGPMVDVMAPGSSVLTCYTSNNSSYAYVSGTSFSTPLTAGLCALIWSADPALTPNEVESILKTTCDDLGAAGVDDTYAYGRIDVNAAMVAAGGGVGVPPPVAQFSGAPLSGTAPLTVSFQDLSSGPPATWSWDFGDGGSSTAQHPSHTYTAAGDFTVTLTVTNASGQDSEVKSQYIHVTDPGGYTGQGFILSKNPDFSTNDRAFSRSDTIYMLVWSDQVNFADLRYSYWQLKAGKKTVKQNFVSHGDFSYTASYSLSQLPSSATSWNWSARIEDRSRVSYRPSATITVN